MNWILPVLLALSLASNAALFFWARSLKKKPAPTYDASLLLSDLTRRGGAVVKVEVIDASELFVRSPRFT